MKRISVILLYIYVSTGLLRSQDVSVRSAFDSSRIFLGDQINFTVTIERPVSYILTLPVFRDTIIKNIEILNGPVNDTSFLKDGRVRIRQKYLITSFDSGFYQVPPVFAEFKSQEGIKRYYSDYAALEVMRVRITPPDTASGIFDIIAPYKAPVTLGEVLPWILMLILLVAITWYTVRFIKRYRRKKTGAEPEVPSEPAHIIALRELEKLKEAQLWQKGEIKQYYTILSEILRQYLENRYAIYSLELTTIETLSALLRSGFKDDEQFRKLKSVLTASDLVKFAKHNPDGAENEQHFDESWDFVSLTRLVETPEVEIPDSVEERREDK